MNILIYSLFFLLAFGQLSRISFLGQQVNGYLYEVFILLFLAISLVRFGLKPMLLVWKKYRIIYFFFIWLLISYIIGLFKFSFKDNFVGILYFLRLLLYFLYFFYLSFWLNKNKDDRSVVIWGLLIFTVFTIIGSLIQYFFYQDLRNLIYLGWDPHLYRMFGAYFDTSISGAIYGLLFLSIYTLKNKFIGNRNLRLILLIVLFISIVLSYNRGLYFVFVILTSIYLFSKKKIIQLFIIFIIFVSFIILAPKPFGEGVNLLRTASIMGRVQDYQNAYKIFLDNPIFGIGYNRIRYVKLERNLIPSFNSDVTHSGASFSSSFLIILVSGGLIGLILFILSFLKLGLTNQFSKYLIFYLGFLSLFDNILLQPFLLILTLTFISVFSNLFDTSRL